MSIFDSFDHQILRKASTLSLSQIQSNAIFSGVLSVKIFSDKAKAKTVKITSSNLILFSIKTQKPTKYLDFKDMYHLKYQKNDASSRFGYAYTISLQKSDNFIIFATSNDELYTKFVNFLKKFCVLESFSDDFELSDLLGSGHFSTVYLAQNKASQQFAAKIIKKNDPSFQQNKSYIIKEIKILRFLPKCPYIIELFEVYETNDEIIMILEYMKGKDLYHQIKEMRKIPEQQAFTFFSQIMKGMLFLDHFGICHRDIKPDNILFSDENRLKIADFSLAEYYENKMKDTCGTPGYMAPEVFHHESYNEKVDVFSLGVVLFTM